jgi:hypothetical protein
LAHVIRKLGGQALLVREALEAPLNPVLNFCVEHGIDGSLRMFVEVSGGSGFSLGASTSAPYGRQSRNPGDTCESRGNSAAVRQTAMNVSLMISSIVS